MALTGESALVLADRRAKDFERKFFGEDIKIGEKQHQQIVEAIGNKTAGTACWGVFSFVFSESTILSVVFQRPVSRQEHILSPQLMHFFSCAKLYGSTNFFLFSWMRQNAK